MREMVWTFLRTANVCVCVCVYIYIYIYSLQYVIDTSLRLVGTYKDVLLTCYSPMFAVIPETYGSWMRRCVCVSCIGQSLKPGAPTLLVS